MILKSITLNGFKSFAKKTTIDISSNVTGIVGPNGSGKSNIAEAIRFVVGEQSMKTIRSKSLSDLVFKGSSGASALSRASVSIHIDNKIKSYDETLNEDIASFLAYDEIILSREVYLDGGSSYKINNTEVRLKDVQSLLGLAGIGASAHTIISQGEADKILLSNAKERKDMLDDALGIRVHRIRLRDSEKKLEKVKSHLMTVDLMRKQIEPELKNLRLQIEKIDKLSTERDKLLDSYIKYFAFEQNEINNIKNNAVTNNELENQIHTEENYVKSLRADLDEIKLKGGQDTDLNNRKYDLEVEKLSFEKELAVINFEKNNLLKLSRNLSSNITLDRNDLINLKNLLIEQLEQLELTFDLKLIADIRNEINVIDSWTHIDEVRLAEESKRKILELDSNILSLESHINIIAQSLQDILLREREAQNNLNLKYEELYKFERNIDILKNKLQSNQKLLEDLKYKKEMFDLTFNEAKQFVGFRINEYVGFSNSLDYDHRNNIKQIERLKIRIEELGVLDVSEIRRSFDELNTQDEHLRNETEDLESTEDKLNKLIDDLKTNMQSELTRGIDKINFAFNNLFHEVFPGGRASINLVKYEVEEEGEALPNESVLGVELDINLPSKKVSDINMLSGGEKTLCSIALLFAMTSVNPPPFMVLDETDAALDEMNAKKYGKLLSKLAEKSRLLVITHNRETMNECDLLYGVTVGSDGTSRILSIKFDMDK